MARKLSACGGCLLGMAAGDALGYTIDDKSWQEIQEDYGPYGLMGYDVVNGTVQVSSYTQVGAYVANGLLLGVTRGRPELFEKYPNLYGDLSANSGGQALMRDPVFGLAFLEKYADRLFFATDMVNRDMVFPLGAWLDEKVASGALRRETYEKIVRDNARRVFGL